MKQTIISIDQLTKTYENKIAVDNLSLTIKKGEVFGLLGPNGAGKSTTILMMLGLIAPTEGSIRVNEIDPVTNPISVKKIVGYLPDNLGFYPHMTGKENLLYTAYLNGYSKKRSEQLATQFLDLVNLGKAADQKAGTYSRGMKQRLGIADVLMKEPEIIILDEPTLGIDPEGVRDLLQLITTLNEEKNMTILLSSHQLHQVQQICDRVGLFVDGKLLAKGSMDELITELFPEETYIIEVEMAYIDEEIMSQLQQLEEVRKINQVSSHKIECYCTTDLTTVIVEKIVQSGNKLSMIRMKDFGLNEIYHRYFEGREKNESA